MSQDIAIKAQGLGKCYRRQIAGSRSDSLRDALKNTAKSVLSGGRKSAFEDFWALDDVSFEIKRGENVGIIGLNGAGKSTLLKLLSRITAPTKGTAEITGRMGALLEVGTGFHGELTGRENTYLYGAILGMSRAEVASKFDAIVAFSEIGEFIDVPVKRYSSGMYVRLAFAVAAHLDPDILLLDEVLAVGDFTFQRKCMDFAASLEQKGATILFVSHNMFSIKSMCERVIYLKKGKVVYDGPTAEGLRLYENDSRLAKSTWFYDENTQPAIRITDVAITNERGEEANVVNYGERLTFRIHYKTFRPIERPDFRIGVNRSDEVHCSTYSSFADDVDIPMIDGEGVIEVTTPPITLVSELYTANISVREKGFGRILCAQIGGHFHVSHPVYAAVAFGVYHEPAAWTVGEEAETKRASGF